MAAAVKATYDHRLNIVETLGLAIDNATDPDVSHDLTDSKGTLDGTTTPAVTKVFTDDITLSGGLAALDLTALAGPMGTTVDFVGLKIQFYRLHCPSTNTQAISVGVLPGLSGPTIAETGYNLFGPNNLEVGSALINPKVITASEDSASIDLQTAGVKSVLLTVWSGTITDGTFAFKVQDSDDDAAWSDVSAGDGGGTLTFTDSLDDFWQRFRYVGSKRYVRLELTVTGSPATGGLFIVTATWLPAIIEVMPGQTIQAFCDDETADVVQTLGDVIRFHGTGTETIEVALVAG